MHHGTRRRAWLALVLTPWLGASFCPNQGEDTPELVWVQFNATDDVLLVEVTTAEPGPMATADLRSSTGEVVVGEVQATPGSGPVGTDHHVVVVIEDDWSDVVQRVELVADSGERGSTRFVLEQDSADASIWVTDLTSLGEAGEVRTDAWLFELFELVEELPDPM